MLSARRREARQVSPRERRRSWRRREVPAGRLLRPAGLRGPAPVATPQRRRWLGLEGRSRRAPSLPRTRTTSRCASPASSVDRQAAGHTARLGGCALCAGVVEVHACMPAVKTCMRATIDFYTVQTPLPCIFQGPGNFCPVISQCSGLAYFWPGDRPQSCLFWTRRAKPKSRLHH